ncbi:AAA family ATPase, partial [Acidobacteriota bacterium]
MLKSLCIRNLATIEEIELVLSGGFSVLTGETGAGKSIIIDGIRLITGGKGSPDMVRTGEKQTSVEAVFQSLPDSPSTEEEEDTLLQRIQTEKGSGRGFYNGQMIPVKTMREYGEELVDIYGQNDHVFLRKPVNQLDYLDSYAEAMPIREKVAGSAQNLRKLMRLKADLESRESDRVQRQDYLNYMIKEIEDAELIKG